MINEFTYFGTRITISVIIGLIMGVERTLGNHSSGIKTFVFVSIGSCLFSSFAFYLKDLYPSIDPTRIIGQIVTGIGFLGSGIILRNNSTISGLTTSAMIWSICALSIMVGFGLFFVPVISSIFLVLIVVFLRWLEKFLNNNFPKTKNHTEE